MPKIVACTWIKTSSWMSVSYRCRTSLMLLCNRTQKHVQRHPKWEIWEWTHMSRCCSSLVLILNIDTLIAAVVISSSLPPISSLREWVELTETGCLVSSIMHLLPQDLMCDKWPISAQTPTGPWPEGARSVYLCYADVVGSFIGASLHRVCMGEVAGGACRACRLMEIYTSLMRCEGVVIPTRGCVYFSLFICAPETTGRWNSPTSASALGDLVEIVVCASSAEFLCDYADWRQSQHRYQASGVREVPSGWYCRWRANAL